jgi:hypothetical protein
MLRKKRTSMNVLTKNRQNPCERGEAEKLVTGSTLQKQITQKQIRVSHRSSRRLL